MRVKRYKWYWSYYQTMIAVLLAVAGAVIMYAALHGPRTVAWSGTLISTLVFIINFTLAGCISKRILQYQLGEYYSRQAALDLLAREPEGHYRSVHLVAAVPAVDATQEEWDAAAMVLEDGPDLHKYCASTYQVDHV